MEDRIKLILDIQFSDMNSKPIGRREINVQSSLTMGYVEDAIKERFGVDASLALMKPGMNKRFDRKDPLSARVNDGETLVCMLIQAPSMTPERLEEELRRKKDFSARFKRVFLMDQRTLHEFDIKASPAIVGRPDASPATAMELAVNLQEVPDSETVSRRHAVITEEAGVFYIEPLNERNGVLLNSVRMKHRTRETLNVGATIQLGRVVLIFKVIN